MVHVSLCSNMATFMIGVSDVAKPIALTQAPTKHDIICSVEALDSTLHWQLRNALL